MFRGPSRGFAKPFQASRGPCEASRGSAGPRDAPPLASRSPNEVPPKAVEDARTAVAEEQIALALRVVQALCGMDPNAAWAVVEHAARIWHYGLSGPDRPSLGSIRRSLGKRSFHLT